MNIKQGRVSTLASAILCALWASQAVGAPAKEPVDEKAGPIVEGFQLTVEAEEKIVKSSTPIRLHISLKNITDRVLVAGESHPDLDYAFEVTDEKGEALPLTRFGYARMKSPKTFISYVTWDLSPGNELKAAVNINRYFDMTLEGVYFIKCIRRIVPKLDKSGFKNIESHTIRVMVDDTPRPPKTPETQ